MYISVYKDLVFIEGSHPDAKIQKHISVSIKGAFISTQSKTLNNVKEKMLAQAYEAQANAITGFKYGQKSTFLGSLMNRDDIVWYGEGDLAVLPTDVYNKYIAEKK